MLSLSVILVGLVAGVLLLEAQSFRSPIRVPQVRKLQTLSQSPLKSPIHSSLTSLPPTIFDFSPSSFTQQAITAAAVNLPLAVVLLLSSQKSLTKGGLFHATLLGLGLWSYLGLKGWLIGVMYFILGSLVTKIRMKEKERLGIAEKREGARGPENVWGSAATAMTCAALTAYVPLEFRAMLQVGFVTAFATKLADTFSSEIGKAFGQRTFLITTLQRVPKGTEGAVSLEGTVSGIFGSVLLALAGAYFKLLHSPIDVANVVLSAFVATTLESYIGAVYQDDSWLNNEMVNLLMTVIGASLSMMLYYFSVLK